ncbi:hypothetical protein CFC21_027415 [Triticum aestivum]|uniref:H(+)/Pi cotransporter n=4 Tax=Triticinae TaxID=1648030 RepID=A0A3B6D4Z1_WHEAT|nr:putative inorganic phosphate transporter 1-13 [Aegilops tauschii subsp. strangulata]XP_044327394.1 putative inorganic phosphate transporter 1-13 [Triticum aestivum]APP18144.1 phosphate transporter 13 [Triticum aestivum]KAF7013330.1 hypothetical protein CFC21_027415 [Triticum aestivum]
MPWRQPTQALMARKQLKVLHALDIATTQVYHFTAIAIAGMGFFTDAYDLFSISLVTDLLGRIYYTDGVLPVGVSALVNGVALCGTVVGQLFFGWLGDKVGRRHIYGVTLKLMVICSIASGLSFHRSRKSVITTLCFFRFWLGFGIGGDYPLSATIMAEYANKKTRGAFIAAVFAMQGLGNLAAGIVAIIVSQSFKHAPGYDHDPHWHADYVWRIILMVGAIPAILTYYWRMRMPETARFTALIAKDIKKASSNMALVLNIDIVAEIEEADVFNREHEFGFFTMEFVHRHGLHLLSTMICWFMLDMSFYLLNLFMKNIFTEVRFIKDASTMSPLDQTYNIARTQALITVIGTLPGFFFAVKFMDRIGRIKMQIVGFIMMSVFMLGLAIPQVLSKTIWYSRYGNIYFIVIYSAIMFFTDFGPNSTTFILPAEIFPARMRSTCHGIAGAGGKGGAITGVLWFLYANKGLPIILFVLVGCNIIGLVFTLILPETKKRSLEEVTGERGNDEDQGGFSLVRTPLFTI